MSDDTPALAERSVAEIIAVLVLLYFGVALFLGAADGPLTGDDHYSLWPTVSIRAGVPFYDPGTPLQTWLSYAGQILTGYRPLGALLVALVFKILGFGASYLLARRLAGQIAAAATVLGLLTLTLGTTIYGYDRFFIYPVAVLATWAYLDKRLPSWVLGVVVGVAFLLRHDHGAYVVGPMAAAIAMRNVRHLPLFGAAAMLTVAPWLLAVHRTEGLFEYFAARLEFARALGLNETRPIPWKFSLPWNVPQNLNLLLWDIAVVIPLVALACGRRNRYVALLALMAIIATAGLVREPVQFGETAALWMPLLAWLTVRFRAMWLVTAVSAAALGLAVNAPRSFYQTGIDNGGIFGRPFSALRYHSQPPTIDAYAPLDATDERLLVRYLHDCLAPGDRVWETVEQFPNGYQTRHPLVDHPYWSLGFRADEAAQRAVLASLPMHPAPIIVTRFYPDPLNAFARHPLVQGHVRSRYRVAQSTLLEKYEIRLLIDREREPQGTFTPLGLPCFAPRRI